jgi:hypothetical protein
MPPRRHLTLPLFCLALGLAGFVVPPAYGLEKGGMPDLSQIDQTCLPTSTANLILWFGKHGYPKLIQSGATEDDRDQHTVHVIMTDTDARFDWGTRMSKVTIGIRKYIQDAGYDCDVEYRGLDYRENPDEKIQPFAQDWLRENDDPNKGFILLLAYCKYDPATQTFSNAWDAGHAVTLVNAEPDMILIHDPAHDEDEPGRKILTPQVLTAGAWQAANMRAPVNGLLLLSGSLLEAPPDAGVMLTGAVCITMHPVKHDTLASATPAAPNSTLAGLGSSTPGAAPSSRPSTPSAPTSRSGTWAMWLFDLFFKN